MSMDIMTQEDYTEFKESVEEFFKTEGITNLSREGEPFFSWSHCNCCGGSLGGDREKATGFNPTTKEIQEYTVCTDCLYYAEYGQLDDMTMLRIGENAN